MGDEPVILCLIRRSKTWVYKYLFFFFRSAFFLSLQCWLVNDYHKKLSLKYHREPD